MRIDTRILTVSLVAFSSAVACGSDTVLTAKGKGNAGDASTDANSSGNGGSPGSTGGGSNGGRSGSAGSGATSGASGSSGASGASGSSGASGASGSSGASGASNGGAAGATGNGGTAGGGGNGGTGAGGRGAGGSGPLDGGTLCHRLGNCCAALPAGSPFRPSCETYANTGTPVQCQAIMGLYCGAGDGGGGIPTPDAGAVGCSDLAQCCPGLGPQQASCEQVVAAGVAFACAIFKSSLCPP
jgi:hypothetical protein